MAITIFVNGVAISYPQTGDPEWGDDATDFAIQTAAAFLKLGLSTGTSVDIPSTLDVTGATKLDSTLEVDGATQLDGSLTVAGTTTLNGTANLNGNIDVVGNSAITGVLLNADGSATSPSITFTNDTNTGLYRISADKIGIATNGQRVGEIGNGYGGFTGNVIQAKHSLNSYQNTNTLIAYTDINSSLGNIWEVSITPKYSNSKIIIICNFSIFCGITGVISTAYSGINISRKIGSGSYSQIYVDASNTGTGGFGFGINIGSATSPAIYGKYLITTEDEPNSSSQITYKFGYSSFAAGQITTINANGTSTSNKSTVILMEIQQ
jgi:hypothetical protein